MTKVTLEIDSDEYHIQEFVRFLQIMTKGKCKIRVIPDK